MTLGENVKYLRELKGLTYEAVGKAAGTDGQNIFNLEKRKSKVSKFAPALAQFFAVDLNTLTSGDVSVVAPSVLAAPLLAIVRAAPQSSDTENTDKIIELLALFQQSGPGGQDFILDAARSIAGHHAARWVRVNGN